MLASRITYLSNQFSDNSDWIWITEYTLRRHRLCLLTPRKSNFSSLRSSIVFPFDRGAKKTPVLLFLKSNDRFLLFITTLIHKWQITIVNAEMGILLKCSQIAVELRII
jgi:hypothetical protein